MRKVLAIAIIGAFLVGCGLQDGRNTDQEMYRIAHHMYQDHLFELAVDSTLFMPVVVGNVNDSLKSYRWITVTPKGDTIGLEVTVARSRKIEPSLVGIGTGDAWWLLVGTKHSKKRWFGE